MKVTKPLIIFVLFLGMAACTKNEVYFKYQNLPASGWNKDSLLTYDIQIQDIVPAYNVFINVRHKGNYPYQNLWLFLETMNPDSISKKDTIECYLADQYGKWLGSGAGALKEMPVIYQQQIHFPDSGNYQLKIGQGMRDSILVGINDVGVRIEKVK